MTTTGPDDSLTGLGTVPEDLEPTAIEARTVAYCRDRYRLEHFREMVEGQRRVVAHESAVLAGMEQALKERHGR